MTTEPQQRDELFTEYVRAGFTTQQAMYLIGEQVHGSAQKAGE